MQREPCLLIVITGPVGAGKSSTGLALGEALRSAEQAAAVIDLDQIYGFVRQRAGYGEPVGWMRARSGSAALANALFSSGMSVVIVEGEFFNAEELDALTTPIHRTVEKLFFTLRVSYENCLIRVNGDRARGLSKDPEILSSLYTIFREASAFLSQTSVVIDTDHLSQQEVVAQVMTKIRRAAGI